MKLRDTDSDSDSDSGSWRPRPAVPYRVGDAVLRVPKKALRLALEVCCSSQDLETCCFLYGLDEVTAVVVPRQEQTWGNYAVSAEAMREVFQRVSPLGLRNLAQLHSHPGAGVEHSTYDDAMANSRRALSIVVPYYGRWRGPWPMGIGVHEFQNEYWHLLNDADAARRVALTGVQEVRLIDLRST